MVTIKHKVTLKRKVAPVPPVPPLPPKKSKAVKIIGGIVAAIAIIAGIFFFFVNNGKDKGDGNPPTEAIAQNRENQEGNNDTTTTETGNNKASVDDVSGDNPEGSASDGTESNPSGKESKPLPSTSGNKRVAEQSEGLATESQATSNIQQDGDVEASARRVIRGDFGNGQVRKNRLGAAYPEIQGKVNEMYRRGLVH